MHLPGSENLPAPDRRPSLFLLNSLSNFVHVIVYDLLLYNIIIVF